MSARTLAQAIGMLEEHVALARALGVVVDAIDQAGSIAAMVRELEQERDGLERQVASLRAIRDEHTTGAEGADTGRA